MKITVVGASGLIGTKVVEVLKGQAHDVVASSRSSGVDVLTGTGLADALAGADALVDVTNSPSFETDAVMDFFTTSATNLVDAARAVGVGHYVALSIVGADGLPDSGYMRAKVVQEKIITESMTDGDEVRVPGALIQPIPADGVAAAVAGAAASEPINGIVNVGGPQRITFEQMARDTLARRGDDTKTVVVDPAARYYGAALGTHSLVTPD